MPSRSAYKITGIGSEPNAPVWIATTTTCAEEAVRVAQSWSDSGVREISIVDAEGRRSDRASRLCGNPVASTSSRVT